MVRSAVTAIAAAGVLQLATAAPAAPYAQYFAAKFKDHEDAALNNGAQSWTAEYGNEHRKIGASTSDPLPASFWDKVRTDALRQTHLNVPTLTMHGKAFEHLAVGEKYFEAGAKCVDYDPQGKLESFGTLVTSGTVNVDVAGQYKVYYNCRSSIHPNFNAATAMRLVVVGGKDPYHNAAGLPSACAVGQYAEFEGLAGARRVRCSPCPPGHFNDAEGATACKRCPSFAYQLRAGQNTCKPNLCRAGTYLDLATEVCESCLPNTYSNTAQLGSCTPCGTNKMGEQRYNFGSGGAYERSCTSSKCLPGTYQRQGRCDPCPINTYQPFWGQLHCIECPDGMRTPTISGNVKCVNHKDALTSEEVLSTYLKPRTCSDITCSITDKRVYTSTQHRYPSMDKAHKYPEVGHRLVIHHGKEGGKALGHNQVNELHGVHHRCAMHDNYQECTCMCWYTPPKYDQWKAVRGDKDELYWSRAERIKRGLPGGSGVDTYERKEAGEYVHRWKQKADGEYERVLAKNLCVSSTENGICDKDLKDVVSDHVAPTEWARQSTLATSWSAATQPQPHAGTGR
jgi:hypothetical protein